MEMAVIIATIALLVALGLPAVRALVKSFETESSAKGMISMALASARAIAAKEQRYAGIRFQYRYQGTEKAAQYMTFIVQDANLDDAFSISRSFNVAYGFRAVKGLKPLKLPETVGVMEVVRNPTEIDEDKEVIDKATFSVVFSSTGKLVIHDVQVLRRNPDDRVFNDPDCPAKPMFKDDFDNGPSFHKEASQSSFVIYDKTQFDKLAPGERFNYLRTLEVVYINPYTGTIILHD